MVGAGGDMKPRPVRTGPPFYFMKKCTCGNSKWKSKLKDNYFQCLFCYKIYTTAQLKKLKDKKD